MAVFDALLKIRADVSGEGQVQKLGSALGGVGRTAGAVTGSIKGLTAAAGMGGLAGAMGALAPMLSVAGLVGMAKSSLEAGDKMFDLAQKTGMSVESLARFKKAAATTGTDLETVAKASMKLSKGMAEAAATGKGPAAEALKSLGISATDASGKLRSADAVMLDIATKFKAMPDGVQKTAAAMQLFGKSGAEMIPMLNQGGDAIEKMKVKMTTAFAEKADQYSDKLTTLSGKVGALGMDIIVTLLPALDGMANAMTGLVDAFNKLDPGIRNVIVSVALLAIAWVPLSGIIAAVVGAFGGLAALPAIIAGWAGAIVPAIASITTALSGLLAWLTGTLLPGLLAFFSGPAGWTVLAVAAVVAMAIAFREPIGKFFVWLGETFMKGLQAIGGFLNKYLVEPMANIWNNQIRLPIVRFFSWIGDSIKAPFNALIGFVRNVMNGLIGLLEGGINRGVDAINRLIGAYNSLPTPDLPFVPRMALPRFAEGGVVDRPTVALVGEGGEREYIIPESKMAAASANYLAGARGASVVDRASINVTTGPVMQHGGSNWVTMGDLERAMRQTETATLARIRTPAGRRALGIR